MKKSDGNQTVYQLIQEHLESKKVNPHGINEKDGVFVYITYKAIRDENGEFIGILEWIQEITEHSQISGE